MDDSWCEGQDWDHDDDDHNEDEADGLGGLSSYPNVRLSNALQRTIDRGDASSSLSRQTGLQHGSVSTSTGTFFSAETHYSIANFGALDVSSYGTSYFSTSPLSQALSKEPPVNFPRSTRNAPPMSLGTSSDYMTLLEQKGLLLSINAELNWSGRKPGLGQHVEFEQYEEIPLEVDRNSMIFCSATAKIDKVRCKRILLARKSMYCHRKMKLSEAMNEVQHLHRLRHSHIVQLVGSYIQGKTFAVLLYPVANSDLKDFLKHIESVLVPRIPMHYGNFMAVASLGQSFSCLAAALAYVHSKTTKHLDIKPQNVLVKRSRDNRFGYQFYLADFGISQSFSSSDQSQTDSRVGRTAKYCAPEVYADESHGRGADIFSLGCVFLEILTVLCRRSLEDLDEVLQNEPPIMTFHGNLPQVFRWIHKLTTDRPVFVAPTKDMWRQEVFAKYRFEVGDDDNGFRFMSGPHTSLCILVRVMMNKSSTRRPTAADLVMLLDKNECCDKGREPFRGETGSQVEQVDPSAELYRLFKAQHQFSDFERREILQYVVQSGDVQLTETLLQYFTAHCAHELTESLNCNLLRISFLNIHDSLLKTLTSYLHNERYLASIISDNIPSLELPRLERLLHDYPNLRDAVQLFLTKAVSSQKTDIVEYILQHQSGYDVDGKVSNGMTMLMSAVRCGNEKLVNLLLKSGARHNSCGLSIAIVLGFTSIVNALVTAGTDVLSRESCLQLTTWPDRMLPLLKNWPEGRQSALAAAVLTKDCNLVKTLLTCVSDDEALKRNMNQEALLSVAVIMRQYEIAKSLLARGADPRISTWSTREPGRTVLHDLASSVVPDNDLASLVVPDNEASLHFARDLITVDDCRSVLALQKEEDIAIQETRVRLATTLGMPPIPMPHESKSPKPLGKTPLQMLQVPLDPYKRLRWEPWITLLQEKVCEPRVE
jgi:serine/threonine protein kinase